MWHEYLKTHLHTFWQTKPSLLCVKMCSSTSQKGPRLPAMQALSIRSQEIVSDAWIFGASNVTISMVNRMGSQIQEISIESLSHFVLISCALNLDRWLDTNGLWLATLSWYRRCVLLIWLSLERKWNDIWCNCKFQDHKFWALALTEVWSVIMPSVDILYQSTFRVVTGNDASPNGQLWCKHWLTIHFTFKHTLFQKRNVNLLLLCCSTRHSGLEDHIYVPCSTVDSGFHSAKLGEHCLGLQSIGLPSFGLRKMNLVQLNHFMFHPFSFPVLKERSKRCWDVYYCHTLFHGSINSLQETLSDPRRRAPDAMLGAWSGRTPPRVQWTRNLGPHRVNHHRPGW